MPQHAHAAGIAERRLAAAKYFELARWRNFHWYRT